MREAMVHLLARYREMRPLFLAAARPMKVEWKMRPYLGVFPRVLRALGGGDTARLTIKAHRFEGIHPNQLFHLYRQDWEGPVLTPTKWRHLVGTLFTILGEGRF